MPRINSSGWKSGDLRIWSGTLDNIPSGWELASEMVDRAVVGAGNAYNKGEQFGEDSRTPSISVSNHTLSTSRIPAHGHGIPYGTSNGPNGRYLDSAHASYGNRYNTANAGSSGAHNHDASASPLDTRQKSIAVIWIRKL